MRRLPVLLDDVAASLPGRVTATETFAFSATSRPSSSEASISRTALNCNPGADASFADIPRNSSAASGSAARTGPQIPEISATAPRNRLNVSFISLVCAIPAAGRC